LARPSFNEGGKAGQCRVKSAKIRAAARDCRVFPGYSSIETTKSSGRMRFDLMLPLRLREPILLNRT
jgi:hypothetical protein